MPDQPLHYPKRAVQARLAILLALALLWGPLASGIGPERVSAAPRPQVAFTFTPRVTEIPRTSTPAPTAVGTLGPPAASVTAIPTPTEEPEDAISAPSCASPGEDTTGYDYLGGSDPPLWMICFGGEVLIVDASDSAASTLLSAFMIAARDRASAANDLETANTTLVLSAVGFGTGLIGFLGGALVSASSCAATPLTFYALGGTGWLCVGGVVVTTGGLGTLGVSGVAGFQAWSDHNDAEERLENSTAQAEQYFHILQGLTAP